MKVLYILLLVLAGLKPAFSDSTLVYKTFADETSYTYTYYLKDNQLRLHEDHSELLNIYDKSSQSFSSQNPATGKTSLINADILQQQVEAMNRQRMLKLAALETQLQPKLKDMNDNEKQASESLLNQLKYPEFYGAHTLLKTHKTRQSKTINNIHCNVYQLLRKDKEIKKICVADNHSLKLDPNDYATFYDFQHFNYNTETSLLLAMGKSSFTQIDYRQEKIDGIPIEIIDSSGSTDKLEMMLVTISRESLDKTQFLPTSP